MALTQIINGMSGLNARNAINAAISSIDGLITPLIAYVENNGDDSTGELGNPAKPFLTPSAAIDAGYANGDGENFGLQLGVGTFYYDRRLNEASFPNRCKTVKGKGRALTVFYLSMQGEDRYSENGEDGAEINAELLDLTALVNSNGGSSTDGSPDFNGGNAGNVNITGNSYVNIQHYGGAGANQGQSGSILLKGPMTCVLLISGDGLSGNVSADGVEFQNIFSGIQSVTMGRCSYLSGTQLDYDMGGNALYY